MTFYRVINDTTGDLIMAVPTQADAWDLAGWYMRTYGQPAFTQECRL